MIMGFIAPLGQTEDTFKKAFEDQKPYTMYLPTSGYVNDSEYQMNEIKVDDIKKISDNQDTANIVASFENDFFSVTMNFKASYTDISGSQNNYERYDFIYTNGDVVAKQGIVQDPENRFENADISFDADSQTCEAKESETYDLWFADSTVESIYNYKQSGGNWTFVDENTSHYLTYKNIDGTYRAKSGKLLELGDIVFSDLDAEKGSFKITFTRPADLGDTSSDYNETTVTLSATIDPEASSTSYSGVQKDGYTYAFEATGSSNGGTQEAFLKGTFVQNESGDNAITISECAFDVTTNSEYEVFKNASWYGIGTIYKQ